MKSLKNILYLLAGATLGFTSCTNELDEVFPSSVSGDELRIETSIVGSRAVIKGSKFSNGDQIGLFIRNLNDGAYTPTQNCSNLQAVYDGYWNLQNRFMLSHEQGKVYAYYPYNSDLDLINDSIAIDATPSETGDQTDFLYGQSLENVSNANPTANIKFDHALARITLSITKAAGDVGDGVISKIVLENDSVIEELSIESTAPGFTPIPVKTYRGRSQALALKGKMDLKTGGVTPELDSLARIELVKNYSLRKNTTTLVDFLVVPTGKELAISGDRGIRATLTIDGLDYSFLIGATNTEAGQQYTYPITVNRLTGPHGEVYDGDYAYVDLGLPSGTLWASTNVGASSPADNGNYFAWGETKTKKMYDWTTYKWCNGTDNTLIKYGTDKTYGVLDNRTQLEAADDVATAHWGSAWCMPTLAQQQELFNAEYTTWTWTTETGSNGAAVNGYRVVSKSNGNSIFLPVTGCYTDGELSSNGNFGNYWTSTLCSDQQDHAYYLNFTSDNVVNNNGSRYQGRSVRPVRSVVVPPVAEEQSKSFTVNGVSFNMIKVASGTFMMGTEDGEDNERPLHQVSLSNYFIGETEVTQELWTAVMGENPSYYVGENLPVEVVNWRNCQSFIEALNALTGEQFSLPTEAQWEFAARGGNASEGYLYSGSNSLNDVAWYESNCEATTHPVASKKANELGLYDMTGNVAEWCLDWYGSYSSSPQIDPVGPETGKNKVCRGASIHSNKLFQMQNTFRDFNAPVSMSDAIGLRLVLNL